MNKREIILDFRELASTLQDRSVEEKDKGNTVFAYGLKCSSIGPRRCAEYLEKYLDE
jgi:hypothetical protein